MNFINKIRLTLATALSAMKTTEDNALNDLGGNMISDVGLEQTVKRNSVSESLVRGELTQEVMMLRDRYYRIYDKSKEFKFIHKNKQKEAEIGDNGEVSDLITFEDLEQPILERVEKVDRVKYHKLRLSKVTTTNTPEYDLRYVIRNTYVEDEFSLEVNGKPVYKLDIQSTSDRPKYQLYKFVEELHIKEDSESNPIVEFKINKMYDFESNGRKPYKAFINDLTKALNDPRKLGLLIPFNEIGFLSDEQDIGTDEGRSFILINPKFMNYEIFGRYIVLRYKMEYEVKETYVGNKYMMDEVTEQYERKAPRK